MKTEYITTNISQRKLAEKYGISRSSISFRAKVEDWVGQRARYRRSTVEKSVGLTSDKEARRLSGLITATGKAVDVAVRALGDERQFNRYIVRENLGDGVSQTCEKTFEKIDTKALRELTGVIKELTALMRDFYNVPAPAQAEARSVAAQRLELERRKVAMGPAAGVGIVISGDAKAWSE